jgi:hypothetical protein
MIPNQPGKPFAGKPLGKPAGALAKPRRVMYSPAAGRATAHAEASSMPAAGRLVSLP